MSFAFTDICQKEKTSFDVFRDSDRVSSEESARTQADKVECMSSPIMAQHDFANGKPWYNCEMIDPRSSRSTANDGTNSSFLDNLSRMHSTSIADTVVRAFEVVQSISPLSHGEEYLADDFRSTNTKPTSPLKFGLEENGPSLYLNKNTYCEHSLCLSCDDSLYQIHFPTFEAAHPRPIIVHQDVNGSVWLVKSALDGQAYFLKEIACDSVEAAQRALFWEIQALQLADKCEHLTVLHKTWWDAKRRVSITLTECCAGGLAPHYLRQAMCNESAVREVVLGALHALKTLHSHGLVHGNCYLHNFFVSPVLLDSEDAIYSTVKLGNFGSTRPDLTYMRSHMKEVSAGLPLSTISERIHAGLPCDDIRQFGQSLMEFLGEGAVRNLADPLRRIILLMVGYLPSESFHVNSSLGMKEDGLHMLRYCPYSAVDLLAQLEKYGSSRLSDLHRAQLLDGFGYSNEKEQNYSEARRIL
ncbi:NEK protein kinase [Perkinsela sp. CCAP 1560/4]|nr:NEK protein kinase [Perkinsela sp. CCAP 1560/4]|eukprot:KNH08741.1 NEK protein kinase [Perkinsela sp. CCAP 1560/4]